MYERSAIVLERYFEKLFKYDEKSNIKRNYKNYCNLVNKLENYQEVSEAEDKMMDEYEQIAKRIKTIQKTQESLYKRNLKLQEERSNIFQNIDEPGEDIEKYFKRVENEIDKNNEQTKQIAGEFVKAINEFNEKSSTRTKCGRNRRSVENDYNTTLEETVDNFKNINVEAIEQMRQFNGEAGKNIEKEIREKMLKNGEKEKVPFDAEVIDKAISLEVEIQKKETICYCNVYDRTRKLLEEIKNGTCKLERHKKLIKDCSAKIKFLNALREYLIQFLDNERLTIVNGEKEHRNLMKEACKGFEADLVEINNLYELLLREMGNKANKKAYRELYNIEYLRKLEKKEQEFEDKISSLNLIGTIINPNYWRTEGIRKIYSTFAEIVTEEYERDLSEFKIEEEPEEVEIDEPEEEIEEKEAEEYEESEIDKKIDEILGLTSSSDEDDDWKDDFDLGFDDDEDEEIEQDEEEEEIDDEYILEDDEDEDDDTQESMKFSEYFLEDEDDIEVEEDDEEDDNLESRLRRREEDNFDQKLKRKMEEKSAQKKNKKGFFGKLMNRD